MEAVIEDYKLIKEAGDKDLQHIPGHKGLPFVGRLPAMVKDLHGVIQKSYDEFGEVSLWSGGLLQQTGVMVLGPDNYQRIFLDPERNMSTEMGYQNSIGIFYGGGLLMRDFADHRLHRRVFQTAFKNNAMQGYAQIMNPIMERGLAQWHDQTDFQFFNNIKEMLLGVAAGVFFGVDDLGEETQKLNQAFIDVTEKGIMAVLKWKIPGMNYYKGWQGKYYMDRFIRELIPIRRAGDGTDCMSFVVKEKQDNGDYFSDRDLIQHLSFLLFAAHDTTTSALSHLVMFLGQNPDFQERIREECKALNKAHLDYEDLDRVPNLHNAFMESLRLHPSVSILNRRVIRECEFGGYTLPPGTNVYIPPHFNHRMPEWWDNPNQFDPDRFAPGREEHKRHSFNFIPFGGGAHKCIGMHFAIMNAKCFMHQFVLNYRFSTPPGYNPWMQTLPMPRPGDFLPLKLERV